MTTVDDSYLEELANDRKNLFAAVERLEDGVHLRKFMAVMDPETRAVFAARIRGYSVTHIAKQLGVKRNCLYVRYGRGFEEGHRAISQRWVHLSDNQKADAK